MIKLFFPFTIEEKDTFTEVRTHIERKENIISFSLEYRMNIFIKKGRCLSVQKHGEGFVYVFEFEDINDAIQFEDEKECEVVPSSFFSDPNDIEKEIVDYAEVYVNSGGIKKKHKKKLVEDENGFKRYI